MEHDTSHSYLGFTAFRGWRREISQDFFSPRFAKLY